MAGIDLRDIDEVIERLDDVIEQALESGSRMGWFAAMYRRVTIAVRTAIVEGRFVDGQRMVRFDRIFADRFLDAWDDVALGRNPTRAWQVAFDGARKRRLVIVQQLLLGMNAHINLDLGIAAANVAPGEPIESLRGDFDTINTVLAELTKGFVDQVDELSPWFGLLDRVAGRTETVIIKFNIDLARDAAWDLAEELAPDAPITNGPVIDGRDEFTADLGRVITRPGLVLLPAVLLLVRAREPNDVNFVTRFLLDPP